MVTTRRGTETPGQDATPRSSARTTAGKRGLDAIETPTAVKRQRKSPPKPKVVDEPAEPEIQDSTEDTSETIVVAVPKQKTAEKDLLPIRRRSSPKVVVAKLSSPAAEDDAAEEALEDDVPASDSVYETPQQGSHSVYATPATTKKAESPTPRDKRRGERSSAKKSSAKKQTVEVEDTSAQLTPKQSSFPDDVPSSAYGSEQAPISSQDAPTPTQPAKEHVRFGSEELVTMKPQSRELPAPKEVDVEMGPEDDDSDSDEAPDVVSTTAAASKAASSQQDAARAHAAQQEKARLKLQERQARIEREQADKRAREEKKAKKLAKQLAKQQGSSTAAAASEPTASLVDRTALPALLPDSFLSALSDQRAPTPPPVVSGKSDEQIRKEKLSRHIKFLEKGSKGPKDIKKGGMSVAVLGGKGRAVLPPKANRDTRNVREKWLGGRRGEGKSGKVGGKVIGGKVERRAFGVGGFLKGE